MCEGGGVGEVALEVEGVPHGMAFACTGCALVFSILVVLCFGEWAQRANRAILQSRKAHATAGCTE